MSWFLYRLGRWSFRHRRLTLVLWIVGLLAMGGVSGALQGPTNNSFSMPGLESTEAFDLIEQRTPDAAPDGASAKVVFRAPEGEALSDYRSDVDEVLAELKTKHVVAIASPFEGGAVSKDGRTGYATISYDVQAGELPVSVQEGFADVAADGGSDSLLVAVGGDANEEQVGVSPAEGLGVLLAVVVLAITLGTLRAAGMSLLTAIIGVGIGMTAIVTATGFMELGSTTPMLALMLGLAVGIDYALFIVSRYRHELRVGREPEEAAGVAVGTAGSAVVFAGLTVIIALCGLAVANIGFLTEMGLAAAFTVLVAVLVALTLLPALCGFAGRKVLTSRVAFLRRRDAARHVEGYRSMGRRWIELLLRRRWWFLVGGLAVVIACAIPVGSMELALPDQGSKPEGTQPRIAYDLIADEFGAGANGPLLVVVDTKGAKDGAAAVASVNESLEGFGKDVAAVIPAQAQPQQLEQVQLATAVVVPRTGPSDADTADLVEELRDGLRDTARSSGADIYVTGQTAVGVDISASLGTSFPKYLVVVVGLALLLLLVVFRSVLVPIKAVAGFLGSVLVSLGALVAIAQWGWGAELVGIDTPGPLMSLLPLLLTGILFGLAMDYELFLVSRMHEERAHGATHERAIVVGFEHGARVVVAAAIIMISVFGGFAVNHDPIIKTIGMALAIGVLADAFLVRMLLVPAVMSVVGDRIWSIPRWLDRLLPNLDLEGEQLMRRLEPPVPARAIAEPELSEA